MKNHLKILGVLYLVFGLLCAVIGALFLEALAGRVPITGRMSMVANNAGFVSVIGFVFLLESLPALAGGLGLLTGQRWARPLVLILGFLSLVIIPVGTALGIYTIWVVMHEESSPTSETEGVVEANLPRVFPPYH